MKINCLFSPNCLFCHDFEAAFEAELGSNIEGRLTRTEEVEFIYKAQNHKFASRSCAVCRLCLVLRKQSFREWKSKNSAAQNKIQLRLNSVQ